MNYIYKTSQGELARYRYNKHMQFSYINGVIYAKTGISCWKLVYIKKYDDFVLFHRNNSDKAIDFEHPENEEYHRQGDIRSCKNLAECLDYKIS